MDSKKTIQNEAERIYQRYAHTIEQQGIRLSAKGVNPLNPKKSNHPLLNYQNRIFLGCGHNGMVHGYLHLKNGPLAVKESIKPYSRQTAIAAICEYLSQWQISSQRPQIVAKAIKLIISPKQTYLVEEWAAPSIKDALAKGTIQNPRELGEIFFLALKAHRQALELGVRHNDLKIDNVSVEKSATRLPWKVQLIDFGAASEGPLDAYSLQMEYRLLKQMRLSFEFHAFADQRSLSESQKADLKKLKDMEHSYPKLPFEADQAFALVQRFLRETSPHHAKQAQS